MITDTTVRPTRFLWLGFSKAQKKVQFQRFEDKFMKGKFDDMFEPIPSTSPEPLLVLRHDPHMNDYEGKTRTISFAQALTWGIGLYSESSIFFSGYHARGEGQDATTPRFCVKVLFNIDQAEPDHYAYEAFLNMLSDAKFHARHLRGVAGDLVPRHYGVWRARTDNWGGTMFCSVTEWAGNTWDQVAAVRNDMLPLNKLLGRTVERLHDYGIHHNRLYRPSDLHHILFRLDETDAGPVTICFVIDFSDARRSPCTRNLPILPIDTEIPNIVKTGGCQEVMSLIFILNMCEQDVEVLPSTRTYKALRFHERYSALHPSLDNATVMMVQRHHLFDDDLPLEPDIRFRFRPDGMVVLWEDSIEDFEMLAERLPDTYVASLVS